MLCAVLARGVSLTIAASLLLFFSHGVFADELPLSEFPLFTQATAWVGKCVASYSSTLSISFGCPSFTPAACLCTDAKKSLQVASSIRRCVRNGGLDITETTTATQLWADCLTNAGVSARDETLLEDIPLFTQVTAWVRTCAASQTDLYVTSLGCNDYTKAPCMCGDSTNSFMVQSAIQSCLKGGLLADSVKEMASGSLLWSSFCAINLEQAATRSIGEPSSVSGKLYLCLSRDLLTLYSHLDGF